MSPHEAPHLAYAEKIWFDWLRDEILNPDIDDAGATPIIHYLVDLKVLEYDEEGLLKISGVKQGQPSDEVRSLLLETFDKMFLTESGFALVYFLSGSSKGELPPLKLKDSPLKSERKSIFGKGISSGQEKSSDLSNLQIVKKWGNQLRPFLDLEQETIARLQGTHTSREDAQWLFSYILNKTRQQAPAKKWEQLSRKRHR